MLRRVYSLVALFAVLNLVVLGGTGTYLFSKGYLTRDKLRQMEQVMRDEEDTDADAADSQPTDQADTRPAPSSPDGSEATRPLVDLSQESQYAQEIAFREMQRFKDEMDQRMALNNKIMLRITTRREALERNIKAFQQRREQDVVVQDNEGFKKELEIFESLKPSVAMELLLGKGNIEDAAKLMLEMDSRKVAKIIEAAKTPVDKQKLGVIQERMREVSLDQSGKAPEGK